MEHKLMYNTALIDIRIRSNDNYRAIAYYIDGYLNGLLDGHHKAVASALEKRPLKALVIIPTTSVTPANKSLKGYRGGISLNGVFLDEDEMITSLDKTKELFGFKTLSSTKTEEYLSKINKEFQEYEWDKDIIEAEEYFPEPLILARIQWARDISDERLDRIINSEEPLSSEDVLNIATALFSLKNCRFKQLTFYFCRANAWKDIRFDLFTLLSKVKDQEVEDFFIEYLVNYDYCYPEPDVKKIVDDYFAV